MSAVTSVAGYFKKHVLGQSLIRRNPYFYDRACADLDEVESLDLAGGAPGQGARGANAASLLPPPSMESRSAVVTRCRTGRCSRRNCCGTI
jgi:hypothetical protein